MDKYNFVDEQFKHIEPPLNNPSRETGIDTLYLIYLIGERDGFINGQQTFLKHIKKEAA